MTLFVTWRAFFVVQASRVVSVRNGGSWGEANLWPHLIWRPAASIVIAEEVLLPLLLPLHHHHGQCQRKWQGYGSKWCSISGPHNLASPSQSATKVPTCLVVWTEVQLAAVAWSNVLHRDRKLRGRNSAAAPSLWFFMAITILNKRRPLPPLLPLLLLLQPLCIVYHNKITTNFDLAPGF